MKFTTVLLALLWALPLFAQTETKVSDKPDNKLKAPEAAVTVDIGDYHKFTFDLTKPFNVEFKPDTARVIKDTNGKEFYVCGAKSGPDMVKLYVIMDNKFYYECLVTIKKEKQDTTPEKPVYLERLQRAYNVDSGTTDQAKQLAAIYTKLVNNYEAYPNIESVWEWLAAQYSATGNSLPLTKSNLKAIQQEAMDKHAEDKAFTPESRAETVKVYRDITIALNAIQGESGPNPPPPPPPNPNKVDAVWVLVIEEVQERTPDLAKIVTDKPWWKQWGDKVTFRSYDKSGTDPRTSSYRAKSVKEKVNTSEGAVPWIPTIMIMNAKTNEVLHTAKFPTDKDKLKSLVESFVK